MIGAKESLILIKKKRKTMFSSFIPPWFLKNGVAMTLYSVWGASRRWKTSTIHPEPTYQEHIFQGANGFLFLVGLRLPKNRKQPWWEPMVLRGIWIISGSCAY